MENPKPLSIDVFTICKNEEQIIPFFIDYWKTLAPIVNVYVYDGHSTDNTIQLLSQYPDWIHIITADNTTLNDKLNLDIKNNAWKNSTADFVMVCDLDETITSYDVDTLHQQLEYMRDNNFTILAPLSFNLIPDDFPTYQPGKLMHEILQFGFNDYTWETKPILFNPTQITDINYVLGAHTALPKGNVKWFASDALFLIHANFLGFEYRYNKVKSRILSDFNKNSKLDADTSKTLEQLKTKFETDKTKRFNFYDIKQNFNSYYKIKWNWRQWGPQYQKQLETITLYENI